jgi:hypothetical protein
LKSYTCIAKTKFYTRLENTIKTETKPAWKNFQGTETETEKRFKNEIEVTHKIKRVSTLNTVETQFYLWA